jgi:hypothetical protein
VGCDADAGEEELVGILLENLGLGRGDELGEGEWVRREIRRLKQMTG